MVEVYAVGEAVVVLFLAIDRKRVSRIATRVATRMARRSLTAAIRAGDSNRSSAADNRVLPCSSHACGHCVSTRFQ